MPSQYDMNEDDELFRAILEYDYEPTERRLNPTTGRYESVVTGPMEVRTRCIGPYSHVRPIKAYVTRNRGRYNSHNLRIKTIQKVSGWEDVE